MYGVEDNDNSKSMEDLAFRARQLEVGILSATGNMKQTLEIGDFFCPHEVDGFTEKELQEEQKKAVAFLRQEIEEGHIAGVLTDYATMCINHHSKYIDPPKQPDKSIVETLREFFQI